jgi:anti-anti-sigma factor
MPDSPYQYVECQAIVLTIKESHLQGDPISDQLRADLLSAVERSRARHVVLDFQNITFVSSVAFRPLLSLHRKLKEQGGRLVLCGMCERVAEVFHVTRLVSTTGTTAAPFELQADAAAAIASLNQQPV